MRINLVTPFAEKDAVKALGARWDVAKKCWYIVDVADLTPFARWIPDMAGASGAAGIAPQKENVEMAMAAIGQATSVNDLADCGCDVKPWDDCVHTIKP